MNPLVPLLSLLLLPIEEVVIHHLPVEAVVAEVIIPLQLPQAGCHKALKELKRIHVHPNSLPLRYEKLTRMVLGQRMDIPHAVPEQLPRSLDRILPVDDAVPRIHEREIGVPLRTVIEDRH